MPLRFHLRLSLNHRKAALKEAFTALMTADADKVAAAIEALVARLSKEAATRKLTAKEQLILRLNEQYPKARCSPYFHSRCIHAVSSVLRGPGIPDRTGPLRPCASSASSMASDTVALHVRRTLGFCRRISSTLLRWTRDRCGPFGLCA